MIINIFSLLPNAVDSFHICELKLSSCDDMTVVNRTEKCFLLNFCFKWITLSIGLLGVYAARLNLSGKGILRVSCFRDHSNHFKTLAFLLVMWCYGEGRTWVSFQVLTTSHQDCNFNHAFISVSTGSAYWDNDFSSSNLFTWFQFHCTSDFPQKS